MGQLDVQIRILLYCLLSICVEIFKCMYYMYLLDVLHVLYMYSLLNGPYRYVFYKEQLCFLVKTEIKINSNIEKSF